MLDFMLVSPAKAADPHSPASCFAGETSIDWPRSKTTFVAGDRVAAFVTLRLDAQACLRLEVANAPCAADLFITSESSKSSALHDLVGTTVVALMTVRERAGGNRCHGSQYKIEPNFKLALFPTNPTPEQLRELPPSSRVLIEGDFAGYATVSAPEEYFPERTRIGFSVDTPNGMVTILTSFSEDHNQRVTYTDGVLENLDSRQMLVGEKIRYVAFVTEDHRLRGGYNRPYLLEPTLQRQKAYQQLRRTIRVLLRTLESYVAVERYARARRLFAALRRHELTHDERCRANELMARLPAEERSIYGQVFIAKAIEQTYGVNVETLNKRQFLWLADQAVRARRENPKVGQKGHVDISYFFRYTAQKPFTAAETCKLLATTVWERLAMLEAASDELDDYFDHLSLLEQALGYLSHCDDPAAVRTIQKFLRVCLEKGYFPDSKREVAPWEKGRTAPNCPERLSGVMSKAFDTFRRMRSKKLPAASGIRSEMVDAFYNLLNGQNAPLHLLADVQRVLDTPPVA